MEPVSAKSKNQWSKLLNSNLIMTILGGAGDIIGSYITGEANKEMFDKKLAQEQGQFDANMALAAKKYNLDVAQVKQTWDMFIKNLDQQKSQFNKSFGLQKEQFEHQKYMDVINPIVEQYRKSKNIIAGFSNLYRSGSIMGGQAAAPTPSPAPAPNPIAAGV